MDIIVTYGPNYIIGIHGPQHARARMGEQGIQVPEGGAEVWERLGFRVQVWGSRFSHLRFRV